MHANSYTESGKSNDLHLANMFYLELASKTLILHVVLQSAEWPEVSSDKHLLTCPEAINDEL
jgi:hypothetical protein